MNTISELCLGRLEAQGCQFSFSHNKTTLYYNKIVQTSEAVNNYCRSFYVFVWFNVLFQFWACFIVLIHSLQRPMSWSFNKQNNNISSFVTLVVSYLLSL